MYKNTNEGNTFISIFLQKDKHILIKNINMSIIYPKDETKSFTRKQKEYKK